ncbi:acyl-CoA N-acyltransferase [Hypoxylon argillaceum]|nr:acyl-CoA N-acyltransferase [Hypoxylon argillaceum]KAI1156710.1 acyl-CoA N-acyltransferase [Nemania diffusa]
MANPAVPDRDEVLVEVITDVDDFPEAFRCISEAFGTQTHDAIWGAFNPGWDTPEGQAAGVERMVQRWRSIPNDNKGNPHTIFLKATLPDPSQPSRRVIVAVAIWAQVTAVEGHGSIASSGLDSATELESRYPGDETEQRFLAQVWRSLVKRRLELVAAKATADPPCVMALDSCSTHPAFQRRGAASKLVQWGLDEGRRRGIPDAVTEASSMGRHVYARLGFQAQGPDVPYEVDEEFLGRELPPNVFMLYSRGSE